MSKKKKSSDPKPRHVWEINPKTRQQPSEKIYKRPHGKPKTWIDEIDWFG